MTIFMIMCAMGCWACIITAAVFYDMKAAALIMLALLFEALISAKLIVEATKECSCEDCCCEDCCMDEHEDLLRSMEDDGK